MSDIVNSPRASQLAPHHIDGSDLETTGIFYLPHQFRKSPKIAHPGPALSPGQSQVCMKASLFPREAEPCQGAFKLIVNRLKRRIWLDTGPEDLRPPQ